MIQWKQNGEKIGDNTLILPDRSQFAFIKTCIITVNVYQGWVLNAMEYKYTD